MAGSEVQNLKLDPKKQKIVECVTCGQSLVVGKFSKNDQTCETANYYPAKCPKRSDTKNIKDKPKKKNKSAREKLADEKVSTKGESKPDKKKNGKDTSEQGKLAAEFTRLMNQLGFEIDSKRRYSKRYAIDGGGIITIYPHIEPGIAGTKSRLEWFSVILQRAVGVNEEFRRFMPPDAASDCEVLAAELGDQVRAQPEVGMTQCDKCGAMTDEFGIDTKRNKVLCVKPNNCFRNHHTSSGAQSEA